MSTWEIPEKRSRFMWLVKAPEGAERPRVCFLCAPPPVCFALAILAAATELVWAALVGHIVGICVGAAGILIAVFACYGTFGAGTNVGMCRLPLVRAIAAWHHRHWPLTQRELVWGWGLCACSGATKWPAKARIRMTALCTVTTLLTIFTVLLIAVRGMGASDARFKTFPSTCVLPDGCTRCVPVAFVSAASFVHLCVAPRAL